MDRTVIEEIAKQLGMAVDQAGQFISDQLPQFAALKAIQAAVPLIIVWALFVICTIVSLSALFVLRKGILKEKNRKKKDEENPRITVYDSDYKTDYKQYISFSVIGYSVITALFIFILAVLGSVFLIPEIYGWSNYPEAMLIDMALNAVG